MDLIYLAILLVSVAFAITVIYLSVVLYRLTNTMKVLGTSIDEMEKKMNYITPQLRKSMQETDMLVEDIQDKLDATDSVFDSIENIGGTVHNLNKAYQSNSDLVTEEEFKQKTTPFVEGMKWSEVVMHLLKKSKDHKEQSNKRKEG